jgi:hypothetical protein
MTYAIEFRNGSFLANLDAEHGVPMSQAMRFGSKEEAERLMRHNQWICFHGGMVIEVEADR